MATWLNTYSESCNQQLENALLSRMLVSRKIVPDILVDYFTGHRRRLYEAIKESWQELRNIDPVYLKATGYEQEVTEAVQESGSESQNTIRDLHDLWQRREIAKIVLMATSTFDGEDLSTEQIIRRIQEGSSKILLCNQDKKYDHHDAVVTLHNLIVQGNLQNKTLLGYSTGLQELDKYTLGLQKGKTYAIGALKKTGKTQLALKLAISARRQGANVVWNRLEMAEVQLNLCALAHYSGIDSALLGLKLFPQNMEKLQVALNDLIDLDWQLIRERTVPNLRAKIIELQNRKPVDIVVVDYLQRMQGMSVKGEGRAQEVEKNSKELADIAVDTNVAMVVLSQFSKEAERLGDDEIPNMSHLKESQGLAEAADCIMSMHDPQRSKLVFNGDGSYRLHEINMLVEQRFGLSGARFKILGDLRTSNFYNHDNPYG